MQTCLQCAWHPECGDVSIPIKAHHAIRRRSGSAGRGKDAQDRGAHPAGPSRSCKEAASHAIGLRRLRTRTDLTTRQCGGEPPTPNENGAARLVQYIRYCTYKRRPRREVPTRVHAPRRSPGRGSGSPQTRFTQGSVDPSCRIKHQVDFDVNCYGARNKPA